MTTGDIERMPPERRRLLVDVAAREFASTGYERASLNQIIRNCGLSKSSFYHVIASKRELFDLVVRDLSKGLVETIDIPQPREFSGPQFWVRIEQLFDELLDASQGDEVFLALGRMFYLSDTSDHGEGAVAEALGSIDAWLRDVLSAGRESGAVRNDLPVTLQGELLFAVLRAFDEWTVTRSAGLEPDELSRLVGAQLATIRRILEPTGGPSR